MLGNDSINEDDSKKWKTSGTREDAMEVIKKTTSGYRHDKISEQPEPA